jgi:triphosphatase
LNAEVVVEASIDRGEIKSGDRTEPVNELELELRSGLAWHLFEFALSLLDVAPVALENRSKAERGYVLYRGERPAPVKARTVVLSADMTVNDAFEAIAWATLNHMQSNERGMQAGGEPEYLHQMRVALRRLRSAFGVFSHVLPEPAVAPIVAELKWLASRLGPARDWDVFVTETLPPIRATFAKHAALAQFARECALPQRAANRKARRAVGSGRYQRLVLSLAGQLAAERWSGQMDLSALVASQAPVTEFAAAVLDRRYARVRKRGRKLNALAAPELHRLRIAIKKFRYAVEFLATLFEPKQARDLRARLAKLQDILGAMNDAAMVVRLTEGAFGAKPDRAVSEARGILLGWSHGRAVTLNRELRVAWKAFRASEKFW